MSPGTGTGPQHGSQPPPEPVRPAAGEVRRVQGDSPWEESFGFARAVAAGETVLVAGQLPLRDGVLVGEGAPYDQAHAAFRNALDALAEFGLDASSVIRTRIYLTHTRDIADAGRAHREVFGGVRPVSTLAVVSGFVDSAVLVQVEVEAYRGGAR